MADIEHPATDPKALKRQERQKFYDDLNKQKQEKKRVKLAERKKIREEYLKQNAEINKYEKLCKDDIKNRLIDLRKQVAENKLNKKDAKIQFKTFRKERIKQFRQDEQRVLNLSSEELRQSFSFRFKRWFFGVGKEFSRVTWIRGKQVLKDFGIILVLVTIMALIFLGLDYLIGIIPRG